jgi:NAD(P)-dependent dehydrogenase (short-subunit alcohol dehydrogenase family)
VIVTGAASGIGRATALRFAREGCRVAGFDVDAARGQGLVEAIVAAGRQGLFERVDVAEEAR